MEHPLTRYSVIKNVYTARAYCGVSPYAFPKSFRQIDLHITVPDTEREMQYRSISKWMHTSYEFYL